MSLNKTLLSMALLTSLAFGQVSSPTESKTSPAASGTTHLQPAPEQPVNLAAPITQLQPAVDALRVDLTRLRIDKWKADGESKRQAMANSQSIQRNLTEALPAMMTQVQANPTSLPGAFKLYRNLNALYDVASSLTESAGAFGPKEEFQALATDVSSLDRARRTLADQIENGAIAQDGQLAKLRQQVRSQQVAASAPPPKKIVIDDTQPAKKAATKKKKPEPQPDQQ